MKAEIMEDISLVHEENSHFHTRPYLVATLLSLLSACGVALLFSHSDLKMMMISMAMVITVPVLMVIPIESALLFYFVYLFLDGAIKINSNYNPVFHVAQDLLMIVLFLRSCFGKEHNGIAKFGRTPLIGLGLIFLGWILLQYLNPFGLGILPSIAGTKVYLTMFAFFLLLFHHLPRTSTSTVLRTFMILSIIEGLIALVEYFYGQNFVKGLNPHYQEVIETTYRGAYYRPFGTTAVAGGPAIWIAFSGPICGYFLQKRDGRSIDKIIAILFLCVALPTLLVCQVRSLMLVGAVGFLLSFCRPSPGLLVRLLFGVSICGGFGYFLYQYSNTNTTDSYAWTAKLSPEQREVLFNRLTTLGSKETYEKSRGGGLDESLMLADKTLLGIGLSRVGAAAGVWVNAINSDPYFGPKWSFADNLYRAIFTELGIFGLVSWLVFVLSMIITCIFYSLRPSDSATDTNLLWTMGTFNLVLLIAGFGSEGILYNPVAAVFWAFQALGMKEAYHEFS